MIAQKILEKLKIPIPQNPITQKTKFLGFRI